MKRPEYLNDLDERVNDLGEILCVHNSDPMAKSIKSLWRLLASCVLLFSNVTIINVPKNRPV